MTTSLPSCPRFHLQQHARRFAALLLAGTALAGLPLASPAQAQTWTGATSTDWFASSNWSANTVPTAATTVVIDTIAPNPTVIGAAGAAGNSVIVGQVATGALTISGGGVLSAFGVAAGNTSAATGAVTVTGSGSTLTAVGAGSQVVIGNLGTGTLQILNGGVVSDASGFVGSNVAGTGVVTVDGLGSAWTNSAILGIGELQSTGTLTISNQGQVTAVTAYIGVADGTGTVNVTDLNSALSTSGALNVGQSGTGALTVSNGAKVISNIGMIGNFAGGNGTVTVDGAGSTWTNNQGVTIGSSSTGTLTVSNGGAVSAASVTAGDQAGSTGTVTVAGTGSILTTTGIGNQVVIGNFGTASLQILSGGAVSDANGVVGQNTGGVGTVTVDGLGSTWTNTSTLTVGTQGTGTLALSNQGQATAAGVLIGVAGGTGTVSLTGHSGVSTAGAVNVGFTGTGTLTVASNSSLVSSGGAIGNLAGAQGAVTVTGAGSAWSFGAFDLTIGANGTGSLLVSNGGAMSSSNGAGILGQAAGSSGTVTVDGTGSSWTTPAFLFVGVGGTGAMTISNGGTVITGDGYLGVAAGGAGTMTVTGANSIWTSTGGVFVGFGGSGALTVSNGGAISAPSGMAIAASAGSVGTLNIGADAASAAAAPGTLNTPTVGFGLGAGSINFNHTSAGYDFTPVIGGNGTINQVAGTTILTADSSGFTGATNVTGGRLAVNGSLAGSAVTVSGSGVLGGTGTVGNTTINGGTLSPGNSIGTLTVQGSLAFTSAAHYLVEVSPTAADLTNVTGTATLGGATVNASFAPGSYVVKQYTILNATGGVSGTFGSVVVNTNLPSGFRSSLSYDANNAYLNLDLALQYSGLSINQQNVANSLTNFFNTTGGIPAVFGSLTPAGLTQVSGELAAGSQQTTFDAMGLFLGAMTDPTMGRRGEVVGPSAPPQFADETRASGASPAFAMMPGQAPPAASFDRRWSVWGAGFGGSRTTNGDAALGSSGATGRVYGMAAGADYLLSPSTLAGFALAGGGTNFSVSNGGRGHSDLFQAGSFVRHTMGPAYMVAALAYGWQNVTTDRTVSVAGADQLHAKFNANAFSGRLEGGYRFATSSVGITPYAAGQFTTYALPAYAEQAVSGTNTFALTYGAKTATAPRSELGIRADKSYALTDAILTLRGRVAWAHDFTTDRAIAATFQTLPGASFVVNGAGQAGDAALTTASAEIKWIGGFSLAATFEGEFSSASQSYTSKGVARYAW
ncbi:T5SS/PEP-CTERM-associated repeat protein [Bradyrhizobium sp. S3.12.5]|uniref:autotransporter domain-containing protein n=1 Tax=Bradyrhizobium sp. S3.12.5 TaxID=3156386 RepID=UPI003399F8EE